MEWIHVERARALLRERLPATRLVRAPCLSRVSGAEVFLKLESELPTGSFKVRGALHAISRALERGQLPGVVTSSTGNHGAAVAWAARQLGVAATVFLPQNPNPVKRARIAENGAEIREVGRDYDDARQHAAAFARERGFYFVEDGRDPNLTPGPATIGWEILEQLPAADVIYVPIGDSTLVRGLAFAAKHLKPAVRVIGVQAEGAPAYYRSWKEQQLVTTETCDTIADGLAVRCPTEENRKAVAELVDDMRLASDRALLRAVYRLRVDEQVVAEPAGAATTAALLAAGRSHRGDTVVLLVTGSNLIEDYWQQAVRAAGRPS